VRNHYFALLTAGERAAQEDAHARIKDYYLEVAGDVPTFPTLDDLAPLIEVVHHACRAGAYDEAWRVYWERIAQGDRFVVVHQLGAYETDLATILEFFPGSDPSEEPRVSDPKAQSWILNAVGFCLMSLGRLGEAAPFYEQGVAMDAELEDWHNASRGYQNLAELHAQLGALAASADAAGEALALARRAGDKFGQCQSMAHKAWAAHLSGDMETAGELFQQAEELEQERHTQQIRYLYSNRGIFHAEHLRRTGRADEARRVTEANLEICERERWANQVSWCHRVLGDLDAGTGDFPSAQRHYDQALKIARGISFRPALIEALLARERWAARHQPKTSEVLKTSEVWQADLAQAFTDLEEALGYALEGGYRIYEADARVGLAWAHLAAGDPARARTEAERARQLSADMGYHWGQVDAAEVLDFGSLPGAST
jgi:tetratricopeptide (TPR) repeat protein